MVTATMHRFIGTGMTAIAVTGIIGTSTETATTAEAVTGITTAGGIVTATEIGTKTGAKNLRSF
jgi:hypothetical protein